MAQPKTHKDTSGIDIIYTKKQTKYQAGKLIPENSNARLMQHIYRYNWSIDSVIIHLSAVKIVISHDTSGLVASQWNDDARYSLIVYRTANN